MTTIAFDGRQMAGDSQQSGPVFIDQHEARKIFRIGSALVGVGGNLSRLTPMLEWFRDGETLEMKPDIEGEGNAVMLVARGPKVFEYSERLIPIEVGAPYAIGSGAAFAMGAMLAGANARKAVEIAIKLDADSGGRIRTLNAF